MAKLYRQFYYKVVVAVLFIFGINASVNAQETVQGIVRLKVSESLAATLERQALTRTSGEQVRTGVPSLDQLNRQFSVRKFSRVFPHAGKYEARHRKHGLHLWYEATLDKSIPVSTILQSYQSEAQILRIEPVYKKALVGYGSAAFGPRIKTKETKEAHDDPTLPGTSNDPMLNSQWHYHNTGQTGGSPGADIDLFDAWKIETGKNKVIIAVTDGGVDVDHPDLKRNLWVNAGEVADNNRDDDNNGYVDDIHGFSFVHKQAQILPDNHGTHVAGTVAAVTNNNEGVAGVAGGSGYGDGVRLMSCAVFHADSLSDGFAEAYVYSADNGAVISQNSWGYTLPDVFEQVVLDAIDYFIAEAGRGVTGQQTGPINGGVVIFSAGNYNDEAAYFPASYPPVIAVASSTHKDTRSRYSNYGAWIDITAPGGETYENLEEGVVSTLPHGNYGWYMGTSMACPHVSGVAGLIASKFARPGLSGNAVRQRLLASVDDIDALNPGYEGKLGTGRLNALIALGTIDQKPPPAIADLRVLGKGIGEITLGWTSPGEGQHAVSAYDLRYSTSPITPSNFAKATVVKGLPAPATPGSKETFTVKNLRGGVLFYFAIRSQNFAGKFSAISNVASGRASETPVIQVSPAALTVDLKTAEKTSRQLAITNKGKGPLKFKVTLSDASHPFADVSDVEGVVDPGATRHLNVVFDAAGLLTGTYKQTLNIESNDPTRKLVSVALTLRASNNGAPIASVSRDKIDFKSVKVGESQTQKVLISNAGSEPLIISKLSSSHAAFRSPLKTPVTIPSFQSTGVDIVFAPSRSGKFSAEITFKVNDPLRPLLKVAVFGEALREAPVSASPNTFHETLERGSRTTRTMTLHNSGSQNRQYRIEVADSRLITSENASGARKIRVGSAPQNDSAIARYHKRRESVKRELSQWSSAQRALATSIGSGAGIRTSNATARNTSTGNAEETRQYATSFEEFDSGPLNGQHGWQTSQGWVIDTANAESGKKHLRGTSQPSGTGEKFALSPYLFDADEYYYPRYTSTSMRINADAARGTTWEIVPQDPWTYIATRIRFNPDGSMETLVIDNDYNFHWKKVPVEVPSGYFDLAIEYNNWGSDTSGFPTYLLFVNNQHVFSGTGLGSGIGQVAIVSPMETTGALFDVDRFSLNGHEYLHAFITTPMVNGTIPGGKSVSVPLTFDASVMKYGSYATDILVHLDENDTLKLPATLNVVGEPAITWDLWALSMRIEDGNGDRQLMTLTNTGGRDVTFNFETDVAGLNISPPKGTLSVRESTTIDFTFSGDPGFYTGSVTLHNDAGEDAIFPVDITVFELESEFIPPAPLTLEIPSGKITTKSIMLKNAGKNPVSFHVGLWGETDGPVTFDPAQGTVEDSLELKLTFDAHRLSPGEKSWILEFTTNDVNTPTAYTEITVNVLAEPLAIALTSPANGQTFEAHTTVPLSASVTPDYTEVARVEFFRGVEKIGEATNAPYRFDWEDVPAGRYSLTAVVTAKDGTMASCTPVDINVEAICTASGTIAQEYWTKVKGNSLSRIPVHQPPDRAAALTAFEEHDAGTARYATRIRGYICPPASGTYTFWIASSGKSELWLSTDDDPSNKKRIAMVRPGSTKRSWDHSSYQRSQPVTLEKGETYYIETLHLHKRGDGHLAVGWKLPDATLERPIAGSRLSPYIDSTSLPPNETGGDDEEEEDEDEEVEEETIADNSASMAQVTVNAYPNPVEGETLNIAIDAQSLPEDTAREVVIRQLTGLVVYRDKQRCSETCDTKVDVRKHLSPGIYVLQVMIGGKVFVEKLLVR